MIPCNLVPRASDSVSALAALAVPVKFKRKGIKFALETRLDSLQSPKHVSTIRSLLRCITLQTHFGTNMQVDYLLNFLLTAR